MQIESLVIGQEQPVHDHEQDWEEEPNPKPGRCMKQKQHIDELPWHVHSPEQVETTNATTQAIRPTARAVQRSKEDGKHHESQNDTSESRATHLDIEDLQGKSLTSHEIEGVLDSHRFTWVSGNSGQRQKLFGRGTVKGEQYNL